MDDVLGGVGGLIFGEALKKLVRAGCIKIEEDNGQQMRVFIEFKTSRDVVRGRLVLAGSLAGEIRKEARKYENDRRSKGGAAGDAQEPQHDVSGDGGRPESPAQSENQPGNNQGVLQGGEADSPAGSDGTTQPSPGPVAP